MKTRRLTANLLLAGLLFACAAGHAAEVPPPQGKSPVEPIAAGGQAVRLAVNDLIATFAERYPKGRSIWRRPGSHRRRDESGGRPQREELQLQFDALQREALLANPLVSGQPLAVRRAATVRARSSQHRDDVSDGRDQHRQLPRRGALKTIDLARLAPRPSPETNAAATAVRLSPSGHRARSRRQLRRQDKSSSPCDGRRRRLSPLRDRHRRHALEAIDLRAGHQRHRPDLSAQRPDSLHVHPRAQVLHVQPAHHGQPLTPWMPTGPTSNRSATARCTRDTPRCCPTAASFTTAGSTSIATSATGRACGRPIPTAPTTWCIMATAPIRRGRSSKAGPSPARSR